MIFISHRGNIEGPKRENENKPEYIDIALNLGFDVEIDVWVIEGVVFLGHDEPQYLLDLKWLHERVERLWIHCKNVGAILFFLDKKEFNFFWHENDLMAITSKHYIWAYPGKQPIEGSIAVLPELNDDDVNSCLGICSDFILKYSHK